MSEAITERIKKLLRLAGDSRGNVHEAERAMQLSFELAEKHRVNLDSLDLDEKSAGLMHEYFEVGHHLDLLRRGIFGLLQHYFHVSVVLCGPRMMVVGRQEDVMIAQYVDVFLRRACLDCLTAYKLSERASRRRLTTNKRASFIAGFIYGISAALHKVGASIEITDAKAALIVAEEATRAAYVKQEIGGTEKLKALPKRKRNESALNAGWAAGRRTQINQPLAAPAAETLRLL